MKTLVAGNTTALAKKTVLVRDFLEITVHDRGTGAAVLERFWSDIGNISADVVDPDSGSTQTYTFIGTQGLIAIETVPRVSSLVVPTITIRFSAVGVDIDRIARTYDMRQAKVRLWRGHLDTSTRRMVAAAEPRFYGFVDGLELPTGTEEGEAYATLTCTSHAQEMTRFSADTRSDQSQRRRSATDDFFKDAASIGDDVFYWGQAKGKPATIPVNRLPDGVMR